MPLYRRLAARSRSHAGCALAGDPLAISVCVQKPIETFFAFQLTGVCRLIFPRLPNAAICPTCPAGPTCPTNHRSACRKLPKGALQKDAIPIFSVPLSRLHPPVRRLDDTTRLPYYGSSHPPILLHKTNLPGIGNKHAPVLQLYGST